MIERILLKKKILFAIILFAQIMMISAENNLLSITVRVTNTITLVFINSFNANRKNKMTMRTIISAQKLAF